MNEEEAEATVRAGEEFAAVWGETLSTEMVSRYASVARRVPPQNRRPRLSWSAHAAVARLSYADQRRMLALAELVEPGRIVRTSPLGDEGKPGMRIGELHGQIRGLGPEPHGFVAL